MDRRKLALAAALLLVLGLFFGLGGHHWLSLEALQRSQTSLRASYAQSPLAVLAAYWLAYVLVAALSIPGATVLTLGAGALFGFLPGLLVAVTAASVGAWLAFLVARFLLQDAVRRRFGQRLGEIDRGVARDGAMYLFTLRLVPLVPFFVINLAMGLTAMRAWTFLWVSLLGMAAGTAVYVNAGTQLAQLSSLQGILQPGLLASLVLLGVFPLLARWALGLWKRRRVYARWQRPRRFDRNLVVIGAGAGGLVSAYIAAAVKAKVTLVEAHHMGGDCLNFGCVPSKALIRSAKVAHQLRHSDRWGLAPVEPVVPFAQVMRRVRRVIADIAPHDSVERYTALGVDVVQGHARLLDPWTVEITRPDGSRDRLTTRAIVLATGASPIVPPLPGLREAGVLTSDTLWDAMAQREAPPRRLVVLGGGPIGCELAQAFARLGSQVTQVELGERLMPREDADVSALVRQSLQADGVRVLTSHRALRCERTDDGGKVLVAEHAGQEVAVPFDEVLCAVGRQARLSGYGLEDLGIPAGKVIETDAWLQTLYPNIYAVGDVAGPYQFTHMAAHQAWYAAVNALFGHLRRFKVDLRVVPWATFVDPEVARVGLNVQEAQAQGIAHEVTRLPLDDQDRAIADGETAGFIQVLTPPGQDRILGVTIVGAHAAELLAEWVLAMKHGLGLSRILGTIHVYPTRAEASKAVAGAWRQAHAPTTVLRWLERHHAWRRG